MIDVVKFSTAFTAFWSMATPTCEHFIRKLNLHLYQIYDAPMRDTKTTHRAFIAEYGYALFVSRQKSNKNDQESNIKAYQAAQSRLSPFQGEEGVPKEINIHQGKEIKEIENRLNLFFSGRGCIIKTRPLFNGCGFIDRSEGDVICEKSLYEIKTVERTFRSNDIRQLITYCALNSIQKDYDIENIAVFNPRRGTFFEISVDEVSQEISGKSSFDLFDDIIQEISGGGISR